MSLTLELLRQKIAHKLASLEVLLPPDYFLTLVARNRNNPDAHIVVTAEKHLGLVVEAIEKLYPEDTKWPAPNPIDHWKSLPVRNE